MNDISIFVAFVAGLVSFASPCVLPVIPGFLAYLAGSSLGDAAEKRWSIFVNSFFFVLGFSAVFSLLGILLNTVLEHVAYGVQEWLSRIGGAVIIFFGLHLVGLIRVPFFERDYKFRIQKKFSSRELTSFLFGAAFAAGWTPCVGAVLGAILGLAAAAPSSAFTLLFIYSVGLGLPFLVTGFFANQASGFFSRHAQALSMISKVFGVVLIILGIFVFTQQLSRIANFEILNSILLR